MPDDVELQKQEYQEKEKKERPQDEVGYIGESTRDHGYRPGMGNARTPRRATNELQVSTDQREFLRTCFRQSPLP